MQGSAHPRYIQPKCQLLHKGEEEETRIGDEGSALTWRRSTCWPAAPLSCGTAWDRSLRGGGVDTGRGKEQEGGIFSCTIGWARIQSQPMNQPFLAVMIISITHFCRLSCHNRKKRGNRVFVSSIIFPVSHPCCQDICQTTRVPNTEIFCTTFC
jgi:hypothetical protein